jgi:type IV pilus assembly protein PilV
MTHRKTPKRLARGMMLVEVLIGLLVFSVGVLGLIASQGSAIAESTGARYRVQAAYFANQLIARMWADSLANLPQYGHYATAGTNCTFGGPATSYQNALDWLAALRATGSGLPGAIATDNHVQIAVLQGVPFLGNTQVTITICWKAPSDAGWHSYTTVSNINPA